MKDIFKISAVIIFIIITQSCKKEVDNSFQDIDGNVYNPIQVGTQVWMKENLRTTRYSNGDLIPTTTPVTLDIQSETTPKYQWVSDGNTGNVAVYGRLYTWYAATDTRRVCPTGWHLPSDDEWTLLITYLGGETVAGGKLKETGVSHWTAPNTGATNETGFTALPGGYRGTAGIYDITTDGYWWTTTEYSNSVSYYRFISSSVSEANRLSCPKNYGFSIRCLQD
jgi:uncharacterized protein (TIGR02145 family)